jgi:hypothetical protein
MPAAKYTGGRFQGYFTSSGQPARSGILDIAVSSVSTD